MNVQNHKTFALLTLAVLMAAMGVLASPRPRAQAPGATAQGQPAAQGEGHDMPPGMAMPPGMNMGPSDANHTESDAMNAMQGMHHGVMDESHMRMTPVRPATPEDIVRADKLAATLRESIERYKDYHVALADGYRIFAPNLPQPMYHFTNYWNGFLEAITFDPARPTSLLYIKKPDGWELIGAMYTAPKTDTLEQLNERVPLGVARWHAHTNLCLPKQGGMANADWKKFGLAGSISTADACADAGGRFYPQIFGWMVHVYPFESSRDKIFAH
jgi:hypothetical protein